MTTPTHLPFYPVGTVLGMHPAGLPFLQHFGLVVGHDVWGESLVIHNSLRRRGVAIESLAEFRAGQPVWIVPLTSNLPVGVIVSRARSRLETPWHLLNWNCEHFVTYALGQEVASNQLRLATLVGAGILLVRFAK